MDKLNKILRPALAKKGLLSVATSAQICFYAGRWGKVPFRAISYGKGVLKVFVASGAAASELHIQEQNLMDYINSYFKKPIVKKVLIKTSR